MDAMLEIVTLLLLIANLSFLFLLLRRKVQVDPAPLHPRFESLEKAQERTERAVREEIARSRDENGQQGRQLREELSAAQTRGGDSLLKNLEEITRTQQAQFENLLEALGRITESNSTNAGRLREEVGSSIKGLNDSVLQSIGQLSTVQKGQLEGFASQLGRLTESNEQKLDALRTTLESRVGQLGEETTRRLDRMREEQSTSTRENREETTASLKSFNESVLRTLGDMAGQQKAQLEAFSSALAKLTESNEAKLEALRVAVEHKLQHIRDDNARQLEQMRSTVNEKLEGVLEQRLGESFRLVSERLEQVHQGLGEMQSLASGVGDLKRVLTNVKVRGTWGEVQLASLLEHLLTPDQYAVNVATREGSGERVEFAIKLPGRSDADGDVVWLPIDAKFPQEDYLQLCEAQERGDLPAVETAARKLEQRIRASAKDICDKYLNPPATTDFGIMFLPTEGLYAEVIRRVGLIEAVQRECRVVIAGPTTLAALLNSLQMGFRTLAIERRSSEVWTVLGAVKTEFNKFGSVLDKVKKKLQEASNVVDSAQTRTRAMNRKLRVVEELPIAEAEMLLLGGGTLPMPSPEDDGEAVAVAGG